MAARRPQRLPRALDGSFRVREWGRDPPARQNPRAHPGRERPGLGPGAVWLFTIYCRTRGVVWPRRNAPPGESRVHIARLVLGIAGHPMSNPTPVKLVAI